MKLTEPVTIRHYCAGGCEHGGGIGRMIGYLVAASPAPERHRVTDTRGAVLSLIRSPLYLLLALMQMLRDRLSVPGRIHHLHIAGRGSTWRKVILAGWAQWLGCRYLLHLHDYAYAEDFRRRPEWQQRRIRRAFAGAEQVIVLGQQDRLTVQDLLGVAPERISILPNAVPDPGRRAARPDAGGVHILFLGQLSARKGVPELLQALSSPDMMRHDWRATLAGDGPVAAYRQQAQGLGLSARMDFPGWLDRAGTAHLLERADILVLPSHAEGLAMAVLEGLAHGLGVVTTPVGAHEEVIEHGISGLFVPVGDVAALSATLAQLVRDPALRATLGEEARAAFLRRHAIEGYVERLERLYAPEVRGPQSVMG